MLIFRGTGDALPDNTPDFVWYGPQVGQSLRNIAAGLDINGDGTDDFVAGGHGTAPLLWLSAEASTAG